MDVPWGSLAKGGQGVGNGTGLQGTGNRAVRVNRAGQVTGTGVSARAGLGTVHRDFLRSDAEGGPSLPFNHIGVQGYIGCRIWISYMAPHNKKGGRTEQQHMVWVYGERGLQGKGEGAKRLPLMLCV